MSKSNRPTVADFTLSADMLASMEASAVCDMVGLDEDLFDDISADDIARMQIDAVFASSPKSSAATVVARVRH